jgi:hypothetical protein
MLIVGRYLMSIQDVGGRKRLRSLLMFFKAYGSSTKDSRINKLHEELRALQKHCAEAYLKDVDLYRSSGAAKGTSMNFEAWMSKFGIFYPASRKEQDRVEQKLHEMAENPMEGAAIALASMRLAAETKHYHLGYSPKFSPLAHFHKLPFELCSSLLQEQYALHYGRPAISHQWNNSPGSPN